MKNKKGLTGLIYGISLTALIILLIYFTAPLFFNSGTSTDYTYTVERTKVGWYKLWLKDDHTTVYCFDDERMLDIINEAKEQNLKVEVTYQDYWFRGSLCGSGSEAIETSVVTAIKIIKPEVKK
jgi:hypothetical protein